MLTWTAFRRVRPDLAEAGRDLLYRVGVGLAFLSTVRRDGGPRLHPFCPLVTDDALVAFVIPSPKQHDLRRDGRFALHSFPTDDNEDAFYLAGRARPLGDGDARRRFGTLFVRERAALGVAFPADEDELFAFDITTCLLTRTDGFGDHSPRHEVWTAPSDG
ncbi:MAG: pyridoxamine 5'-phosphate oxidase family protein [Acidimicrobiales bacterium]